MATVITKAGEALMARKAQANEQLDIDTFIFANVPGKIRRHRLTAMKECRQ